MALDWLQNSVTDYVNRKSEHQTEMDLFSEEAQKILDLSDSLDESDADIRTALGQLEDAFADQRSELDQKSDELEREKEGLKAILDEEEEKLRKVDEKLDQLAGNRYDNCFELAAEQTKRMRLDLQKMAAELDDEIQTEYAMTGFDGKMPTESIPVIDDPPAKPSFLQRLFGFSGEPANKPTKEQYFGQVPIAPLRDRRDCFVKGAHYDQFIQDYYDSDDSQYEDLRNDNLVEWIDPGEIEGIRLGQAEVENESLFWSQHRKNGTKESFTAIAGNIPQVRQLLDTGVSLASILDDDELGACAGIYFNQHSMPCVIQCNGYYEFESNGRHRIIAAREMGQQIPVRVVGRRTRE